MSASVKVFENMVVVCCSLVYFVFSEDVQFCSETKNENRNGLYYPNKLFSSVALSLKWPSRIDLIVSMV